MLFYNYIYFSHNLDFLTVFCKLQYRNLLLATKTIFSFELYKIISRLNYYRSYVVSSHRDDLIFMIVKYILVER